MQNLQNRSTLVAHMDAFSIVHWDNHIAVKETSRSKRKSAILCERMTKDYAAEFGPDQPEDQSAKANVAAAEEVKAPSSINTEGIGTSPDFAKPIGTRKNSDFSLLQGTLSCSRINARLFHIVLLQLPKGLLLKPAPLHPFPLSHRPSQNQRPLSCRDKCRYKLLFVKVVFCVCSLEVHEGENSNLCVSRPICCEDCPLLPSTTALLPGSQHRA